MKQYLSLLIITVCLIPVLLFGVILYILGIPVWFLDPNKNTIFHKLNWYGSGAIVITIYAWIGAYDSLFGKVNK